MNKFFEFKVKFREASNFCERVVKAAKLEYGNKTRESITFQALATRNFWQITNGILNKVKSAIRPLFSGLEVLLSGSEKEKLFAKNSSKNSNLDDLAISYLFFPLELI